MGIEPILARLVPFDQDEQARLFRHCHPDASFENFLSDAARHDLTHLLGNPEFLNLFADAFVQAGGRFTNRHEIFGDAVRYLARETNRSVSTRDAPTAEQRIAFADEVFARLLLSGPMAYQRPISPKARRFPVSKTLDCPTNGSLQSSTPASSVPPRALIDMNPFTASLLSIVQPERLSNGLTILQIHSP